jgi:predicted nuclease of predicted toxin-antitoxin system
MFFLVDQDVYKITLKFLKNEGHDAIPVKEVGLEQSPDRVLLQKAKEMGRIFITRDKDFGNLVFFEKEVSSGVFLLRGKSSEIKFTYKELNKIFKSHAEEELKKSFCVVESGRHRIRKLK